MIENKNPSTPFEPFRLDPPPLAPTPEAWAAEKEAEAENQIDRAVGPVPEAPPLPEELTSRSPLSDVQSGQTDLSQDDQLEQMGITKAPPRQTQVIGSERRFKGVGDISVTPEEDDITILRKNQSDPRVKTEFDSVYGAGSSERYLNVPQKEDVDTLVRHGSTPEARAEFDQVYGSGMSKLYLQLYDQNSRPEDRRQAADTIARVLSEGWNASDSFRLSLGGEVSRGVVEGVAKGVVELGRSIGLTPEGYEVPKDTIPQDHPVVHDLVSGITQFATGYGITAAATGGLGVFARLGAVARGFANGALTDAFAFNPDDPLMGDLAKALGLPSYSVEDLNSDVAKRAVRAAEGGVLGVAAEGAFRFLKSLAKLKAGDKAGAAAEAEEAAKAFERAEKERPQGASPEAAKPEGTSPPTVAERPSAEIPEAGKGPSSEAPSPKADEPLHFDPETSSTRSLDDDVKAVVSQDPPEAVTVKQLVEAAEKEKSPLRQIIETIPDFTGRTLAEVSAKVRPFIDQVAKVVGDNPAEAVADLSKSYTIEELKKLQAVVNGATKKVTAQIDNIEARIAAHRANGNGAIAEQLTKTELKEAIDLKGKLDALDQPLGSASSDLLNSRRALHEGISQPPVRIRIDDLRAKGLTDTQISEAISEAIAQTKTRKADLQKLHIEREKAVLKGDKKAEAKANKKIEKALEKEAKKAGEKVAGFLDKLSEFFISSILASPKTMVVNLLANTANIALRTAAEFSGTLISKGPAYAVRNSLAKVWAFKAGRKTYLESLAKAFEDGAKAFDTETSAFAKDFTLGTKPGAISGAKGRLVRTPLRMMGFFDDFQGSFVSRAEAGAQAHVDFEFARAQRLKEVRAALKDPQIDTGMKSQLTAELHDLNKGIVEIDGKKLTLREHVEEKVKAAFDKDGKLIDEQARTETEKVFLKDDFESETLKGAQKVFGNPAMKIMVQPFFKTPVRALEQGLHYVPGANFILLRNDLRGLNGARAQMIAKGKVAVGFGLATWAYDKAISGEMTGTGPNDPKERKALMDAGWKPNHIKLGGRWYDYGSMEPLATVMKVIASYVDSSARYEMREGKEAAGQDHVMAWAGAFANALTDSSMLSGAKEMSDLLKSLAGDDSESKLTMLERYGSRKVKSFVPAIVKKINDLLDPRMTDDFTIIQGLEATLFQKGSVPMQYDALGNVRVNPTPLAGLIGPVVPANKPSDTLQTKVLTGLALVTAATGRKFDIAPTPPGLSSVDLRKVNSATGKGTVNDRYMTNYRNLRINGKTVTEALAEVLDSDLPVGNADVDGEKPKALADLQNSYKQLAWQMTEEEEAFAHNLQIADARRQRLQVEFDALDPSEDKQAPKALFPMLNH